MIVTHKISLGRIIGGTWKNLVFSFLTCAVAYFLNEYYLSNFFSFPTFVPTILGTALAFFIGFNNNQAYDRWWEARKIWGSLVNNSRTWARQILSYIVKEGESDEEMDLIKARMIRRHIAFLYALKDALRKSDDKEYVGFLSAEDMEKIASHSNLHNAILTLQSDDTEMLYKKGNIDGFKFLEFNKMITAFCDDMGMSERIKNTVFPTTYNYYAKSFIWIFIYSVTMSIGNAIGIWAIIFGTLIGYVFFTIQAIGQILLDPFDPLITGVPLDQITRTIEINLLQMIDDPHVPEAIEPVQGEYVM